MEPLDSKIQIFEKSMFVLVIVYGSYILYKKFVECFSVLPKSNQFLVQLRLDFYKPKFYHYPSLKSLLDLDCSQDED